VYNRETSLLGPREADAPSVMKINSALSAVPPTKKTEHWKMNSYKSLTKGWAKGMESNNQDWMQNIFIRDEGRMLY